MATMIEENGPSTHEPPKVSSSSQARQKLEGLLNKNMRIRMTDGRTLVGLFLCTDRDCNVILGSAQEFLKSTGSGYLISALSFPTLTFLTCFLHLLQTPSLRVNPESLG
ncbi:N-alpha-acetyltransferase 38, NatC auxiliary subunit isoform X2 [Channa argus]|uniref:N-alpha-acetyltransferase 38, NatC auxiliary subunit isoform X2 n=1 Tax=Channa argus TaxID=215402 RepID=UPI00352247EF